jgi:hypothetical protein
MQKREALLIDPGVDDIDTLRDHLRVEVEPILFDPCRPAARQMAHVLADEHDLAAIHIIAHGAPGRICFAAGAWSIETLPDNAESLAAIGRALSANGHLRLWSCRTGAGAAGGEFVAGLAQVAGANVSSAKSSVGAASLGGSWTLDSRAGISAQHSPLTAAGIARYAGLLSAVQIMVTGNLPIGSTTGTLTYFIIDKATRTIVSQVVLPDAVSQNHSVALTLTVPSAAASYAIGTFDTDGKFQPSSFLNVSTPAEDRTPRGVVGPSGR